MVRAVPPDAGGTLPSSVIRLLGVVDSLEKLELICRLHRERDRGHRAAELATEIGTIAEAAGPALGELVESGLAARDRGGGYWYVPANDELDRAVAELVHLYDEDPLRVLRAISKAAFDRIRSNAARAFADAFVIRRKRTPEEPSDG
jgi:hypothetical protein